MILPHCFLHKKEIDQHFCAHITCKTWRQRQHVICEVREAFLHNKMAPSQIWLFLFMPMSFSNAVTNMNRNEST